MKEKPMIQHFTAHTINCVCHSTRSMFRVLWICNFDLEMTLKKWLSRYHEGSTNCFCLLFFHMYIFCIWFYSIAYVTVAITVDWIPYTDAIVRVSKSFTLKHDPCHTSALHSGRIRIHGISQLPNLLLHTIKQKVLH